VIVDPRPGARSPARTFASSRLNYPRAVRGEMPSGRRVSFQRPRVHVVEPNPLSTEDASRALLGMFRDGQMNLISLFIATAAALRASQRCHGGPTGRFSRSPLRLAS